MSSTFPLPQPKPTCSPFSRGPARVQSAPTYKPFSFACSCIHSPPPHYTALPTFLPHQTHDCPPCQLEYLRAKSDTDIIADAKATWPLVKEQRIQDARKMGCGASVVGVSQARAELCGEYWVGEGALERYVEERRQEEKEMWFCVGRKWVQDLKKCGVLMQVEDGLGLLG